MPVEILQDAPYPKFVARDIVGKKRKWKEDSSEEPVQHLSDHLRILVSLRSSPSYWPSTIRNSGSCNAGNFHMARPPDWHLVFPNSNGLHFCTRPRGKLPSERMCSTPCTWYDRSRVTQEPEEPEPGGEGAFSPTNANNCRATEGRSARGEGSVQRRRQ